MAVSKRLRYEVLRRDNHTCRYCGATAPDAPLRIDHVTPIALGGSDQPDNLVTACQDCNSGKTSMPADATHVADVAQDALRWAEAMKQAAEELRAAGAPKRAYRSAFQQAWSEWKSERSGKSEPFDLPDGWKTSLDNFREAGLPGDVWPDIIEKAMTNKTVRADNVFRYCCGIAWRIVRELQDRAKAITGAPSSGPVPIDSVVQAAVDVWEAEQFGEIDSQKREQLIASAIEARAGMDAHRIVEAAQYAAWCGESVIGEALAQLDSEAAVQAWTNAWLTTTGEWPEDERTDMVRATCDALLAADVHVSRVVRAAIYAGSRRSARPYFGLSDEELAEIRESELIVRAAELWAGAFHVSAGRWPTGDESSTFFSSLRRVVSDGDLWIADIYSAAAASGAYQDPDLSACLTRHLSVFEAASAPLAPLPA